MWRDARQHVVATQKNSTVGVEQTDVIFRVARRVYRKPFASRKRNTITLIEALVWVRHTKNAGEARMCS